MSDYRIIDAHTHIYPEKIAEKATEAISEFYQIPMCHFGSSEVLLESGRQIGVEKYLVCSAATVPQQVPIINDFILRECAKHPEFLGFGTVHPDYEDMDGELRRIKALGLRGVKLHPDFQQFYIDDGAALPMFKAIRDNDMFVLVHLGDDKRPYSDPKRMAFVIDEVPGLKVIGAHFGSYGVWWDNLETYRPGTIVFDISSSLFLLDKKTAYQFFDRYGIGSFFWGTDFPMWDHREELERFFALGLSEEENRMILYDNFARYYGLE